VWPRERGPGLSVVRGTPSDTAAIAIEETFGIIGQGVRGLSSWVLTQMMNLLSPLWPTMLTCFGIIALVIITVATFKAGAVATVKGLLVHGRAKDRRPLIKTIKQKEDG